MSEVLHLTEKELRKLTIIKQLAERKLKQVEAAESLSITTRQVRRLLVRYRDEGSKGFTSKLRGKSGNNQLDKDFKEKTIEIIKAKYPDFGPTFAAEKLNELDDLKISVSTLRRIMIKYEVWDNKKQRRKPEHRTRRPRKPCYGDMEQFDGSFHDWFEGRYNDGEYTTLLASIDDATNKVNVYFSDYEGTVPVMKFWWRYFKKYGKPGIIYLDRHSTYKVNSQNALDDDQIVSQFTRAMRELGIEVINAYSPQAKGRVERLFGTLQDRLVKELRLAGINNPTDANIFLQEYLLKFNNKFTVVPTSSVNTHIILSKDDDLAASLSEQSIRIVSRDFVIRFKNYWYQLAKEQPITVYPGSKVIIEERLDTTLHICFKQRYLIYTKLSTKPLNSRRPIMALTPGTLNINHGIKTITPHRPSKNHPWKKFNLLPYNITNRPNQKPPIKKIT